MSLIISHAKCQKCKNIFNISELDENSDGIGKICKDKIECSHRVEINKKNLSPFQEVNDIVDAAADICKEAYEKLISDGFSSLEANEKVKKNFLRVNKNPNLVLSVAELCK